MIHRQPEDNPFEFVIVASLRAAQLMRGCTARVAVAERPVVTAQREVAAGKVQAAPRVPEGQDSAGAPEAVAGDMVAVARASDGFAGSGGRRDGSARPRTN